MHRFLCAGLPRRFSSEGEHSWLSNTFRTGCCSSESNCCGRWIITKMKGQIKNHIIINIKPSFFMMHETVSGHKWLFGCSVKEMNGLLQLAPPISRPRPQLCPPLIRQSAGKQHAAGRLGLRRAEQAALENCFGCSDWALTERKLY